MHASCYDVLQTFVAKVTGKSMFAMLSQPLTVYRSSSDHDQWIVVYSGHDQLLANYDTEKERAAARPAEPKARPPN